MARFVIIMAFVAALLLAGCGGGGSSPTTSTVAATTTTTTTTTTTAPPAIIFPSVQPDYVQYAINDLPPHYRNAAVSGTDNTAADNPITNAGANLGRVLFYDKKLSRNDTVACSSCHQQANGFSDTSRLSPGFQGGLTDRHTPGLANARYYQRGRFFWDERAATLEAQVLQPIQNQVEMGMTLPELTAKLAATSYYPPLFQAAFGTTEVTADRIARALAQFVRSMVSYGSRYDQAFTNGAPNFAAVFSAGELRGQQIYNGVGNCNRCHATDAHISNTIENNGLDATITDVGAGGGRFKAPSLRNVAVRGRFMHDGRFTSLDEVIEFYNSGVQDSPNLSPIMRAPGGAVRRLNLSTQAKADLKAFLLTLTDNNLLNDARFASPF